MKRILIAAVLTVFALLTACDDGSIGPAATGSIAVNVMLGTHTGTSTSPGRGAASAGVVMKSPDSVAVALSPAAPFDIAGHLDSARARAAGPTNKSLKLTLSGGFFQGTIEGLAPGSYNVSVEGYANDIVDFFGIDQGVAVTAGATATASVTFASTAPTISVSSGGFADTVVITEGSFYDWDADVFVTVGGEVAWVVSFTPTSGTDSFIFLVPNRPIGQDTVRIRNQGVQQAEHFGLFNVTSSFVRNADPFTAPTISGGPFPIEFFISVSDTSRNHYLDFTPSLPLAVTVALEWQSGADLDIVWHDNSVGRLTGNIDGATLANPESSTVAIAADTSWILQLNQFDTTGTVAPTAAPGEAMPFTAPSLMAKVTIDESPSFVVLSAGGQHTCGLKSGGLAYCWGDNQFGQLGNPAAGANEPTPVQVQGVLIFKRITTGALHTCGIASDNLVYCWGRNANGQLGDGTIIDRPAPTAFAGGPTESVEAGRFHTCAVAAGGQVYCWGSNVSGKLGTTLAIETCTGVACSTTPIQIENTLSFTLVSAGGTHTCGLRLPPSTFVYCWGGNTWGQLGNGTVTNSTVPVQVGSGYRHVSVGTLHSCAARIDFQARCWGQNTDGQLGSGVLDALAHSLPSDVSLTTPRFLAVASGRKHTCAVPQLFLGTDSLAFGWIYCWGNGTDGELGDGLNGTRIMPDSVAGGRLYQLVTAGALHACALSASAEAYCWGLNSDGRLGNGSLTNSNVPVFVSGQPSTGPPLSSAPLTVVPRPKQERRKF